MNANHSTWIRRQKSNLDLISRYSAFIFDNDPKAEKLNFTERMNLMAEIVRLEEQNMKIENMSYKEARFDDFSYEIQEPSKMNLSTKKTA